MGTTAIVMMVLICGTVWGGLLRFLLRAVRRERARVSAD
ncbi:MAG: methionine/alanine import family NSS transporter small subunit [Acidobacteriota bacterium]